jgi:hypothetical protein
MIRRIEFGERRRKMKMAMVKESVYVTVTVGYDWGSFQVAGLASGLGVVSDPL